MKKLLLIVLAVVLTPLARATTYNVNSSMSESTIQSTVNAACSSSGNTVSFAAGNYTGWTGTLNVPAAHGCVVTGPPNTSQPFVGTTILNSDGNIGTTGTILSVTGCSGGTTPGSSVTIQYLTFDNTAGIYIPASCNGGEAWHNELKNNNPGIGTTYNPNILFDGSGSTASSYWDVSWNNFHDNCATINNDLTEQGGYCSATFSNGSLSYDNWSNNTINGQEEGLKEPPSGGYFAHNTVDYNKFANIHRIGIEIQYAVSTASQSTQNEVSYNYFAPPFLPCYYTFANSIPMYGASSSAFTSDDNLIIAGQPVGCPTYGSGAHYGIAMEVWGSGLISQNNLIEGGNANATGYSAFSLGAGSGANVTNNISCGYDANQAGAVGIDTSAGTPTGYTASPNSWPLNCPVITMPTPTVSPASGSYGSPPTVTLASSRANTTTYYTTDGSTPTVNSKVYVAPFTAPALPATVKAITQWGTGANVGVTFPSGYGYTPSAVQSATYTSSATPVINYPSGFASSSGQIWLENSATLSGSSIHLSTTVQHTANNAWFQTPENVQAFSTTFTYHIVCPGGGTACGDGLGFMILSNPNSTSAGYTYSGFSGAQFSWSQCNPVPSTCPAISSVLVKLDTYNVSTGAEGNLTGFYSGGEYPQPPNPEFDMAPSGINVQSGDEMRVTLAYDGSNLAETVTDTVTNATYTTTYTGENIPSLVAGNTGYIGFGAGTGAALQDVYLDSWTYTVGTPAQAAATPTFSPASETFTSPIAVTLSCSTSSPTMYYTTDGSTPTTSSTAYTSPLTVSATTTVKAICTASGFTSSSVGSATYTYSAPSGLDDSMTGWSTCALPSCNPGGSGTPTSTSQTINNSTPSVDGESMKISQTGTSATNVLWPYKAAGCDSCTNISDTFSAYPTSATANQALEFDEFIFDQTHNVEMMCGTQWNQVSGVWQVFDQLHGAWVNTTITTGPTYGAWNSIQQSCSRLIGDTTCSGTECMVYGPIVLNGTSHPVNMKEPVGPLPSGWTSATGFQFQLDSTAASTQTEYIDLANVTTSTTAPPTYSSSYLGTTGGGNTIGQGSTVQFTAYLVYSDGTTTQLTTVGVPDQFGNSITAWTSSNTAAATISTAGVVTAVAAGNSNIRATLNVGSSSYWTEYITGTTRPAPLMIGPNVTFGPGTNIN